MEYSVQIAIRSIGDGGRTYVWKSCDKEYKLRIGLNFFCVEKLGSFKGSDLLNASFTCKSNVIRCSLIFKAGGGENVFALRFCTSTLASQAVEYLNTSCLQIKSYVQRESDNEITDEEIATILLHPAFPIIASKVEMILTSSRFSEMSMWEIKRKQFK